MKCIPFDAFPAWGNKELNKTLSWGVGVQEGDDLLAPQKNSTLFPKNRYQFIATFWEQCHLFCEKITNFFINQYNYVFFSVLHKAFTAFAYRIRAPPSEV